MANAIVFLGPTGSGKSTVAKAVSQQLNIPLVSSGSIARSIADMDAAAAARLASGGDAPELAIRAEVKAQIEAALATAGGFVIDGFPRKLEQLVILEQTPGVWPMYVRIEIPYIDCIRRLVARNREDDHPDAVAERLRHYDQYTRPVIQALASEIWVLHGYQPVGRLTDKVIELYTDSR